MSPVRARKLEDIQVHVTGPDYDGFYNASMDWEDITEFPVDHTPSKSRNRERAIAFALQNFANRLIERSRLPPKKWEPGIGPTELP